METYRGWNLVKGIMASITAVSLFASMPAFAEGRTVAGEIARIDAAAGTFTVKDAAGAAWSYKVDPDAGIDLGPFREGDRVAVTIARPTPLNMVTAADLLRKGDRVEKAGY